MKRNPLSRLLSVLLCLCLVAGMLPAALAEEGAQKTVETVRITNAPKTIKLNESFQLESEVTLSGEGSDVSKEVKWSSSDDSIISVAPDGVIKGMKAGASATIIATSVADESKKDTVEITVESEASISLSADSLSIAPGTSKTLKATVTGADADNISWSGDNAHVKINGTGETVSIEVDEAATEADNTTIFASIGDKNATCTVTVDVPEVKYNFDLPSTLTVTSGTPAPLSASNISPNGSTISWSVEPSNVVSLSAETGNSITVYALSGVSNGATATITASIDGKVSKTCKVTVNVPDTSIKVSNITIAPANPSTTVDNTVKLTATVSVTPDTASKMVTWSVTSGSDIASVDSSGVVTGKKVGSAVIRATSVADSTKYAECTVTVNPSGSPTISNTTLTLNVGKSSTLSVNNLPTGATVSWSIPNSSIAKLSATSGTSITVTGVTVGGPVRVTATVKNGSTTIATLSCDVTVKQASPSTITYTVAADDTVTLKASDFNSVCNGVYGTTLDYVIFDRSTSNGTLYYDYTTKDGGTKISTSTKYYSSNSASRSISSITFVPDGKSGDKATFPYTAYDTKGQRYAGTLEITIKSPSGNVKYETAKDEPVDFDSGDFDDVCRSITGSRLDYVTFTLPSSSRGTLYYDYGGKDEEKLSSSDKCYADEDDGDFGLDDITFVPKSGYTGTVTFNYSGRSTSRDSFSGTVTITISKTGSTLRYQIDEGEELDLDDSDFNDYCKDQTGANLDYVTFDLPGSSRGTLYYKYGSRDEDDISSSDKFYRSSSPRLDDVTFVPKSGYTGTVSIDFTGRSVDNDRFSGTVKIEVGDTGSGDISYTAPAGSAVSFVLSDFNDLCEDETGERLDYVTFDLPSSSRGTLYYQYGKSGEEKLSSSDKYYRSGSPRLEDVSFVPASSFSGTLEIKFSGRSTDNDRFSGTVAITYTSVKDPAIVRYTSDGGAVNFQSNDFVSACSIRGAGNLVSVKFNTPSSGTLYYGYTSPTSYGGVVNPLISFSTGTGNASISGVTYVPKAGYSGTVTLTYTGTDSKGATFTGNIAITVTPTTGSRFTDMGNYSWAAASVDFLYENGITTGTTDTTYGPAGNITRGDFVLMLARAFNLTGGDPSNSFSDVPANSYYAQAIASAKALGIAQGGGSTFNPTGALTRQDAMVLLHRTLSRTGKTIPDASASYLSRFSDGGSVASYAQSSVAALVQAGVIQGDTSGKLNPQGSLTRAEMAVILHRVLTL